MTEPQKAICRELLDQSYRYGFDSSYLLAPILEKLAITEEIFNEDTQSGLLFEFSEYGNGMLYFGHDGKHAGVVMDTRDLLAHWSDFRG